MGVDEETAPPPATEHAFVNMKTKNISVLYNHCKMLRFALCKLIPVVTIDCV